MKQLNWITRINLFEIPCFLFWYHEEITKEIICRFKIIFIHLDPYFNRYAPRMTDNYLIFLNSI